MLRWDLFFQVWCVEVGSVHGGTLTSTCAYVYVSLSYTNWVTSLGCICSFPADDISHTTCDGAAGSALCLPRPFPQAYTHAAGGQTSSNLTWLTMTRHPHYSCWCTRLSNLRARQQLSAPLQQQGAAAVLSRLLLDGCP